MRSLNRLGTPPLLTRQSHTCRRWLAWRVVTPLRRYSHDITMMVTPIGREQLLSRDITIPSTLSMIIVTNSKRCVSLLPFGHSIMSRDSALLRRLESHQPLDSFAHPPMLRRMLKNHIRLDISTKTPNFVVMFVCWCKSITIWRYNKTKWIKSVNN